MTAERLVQHLERSGFVLMRRPTASAPSTSGHRHPNGDASSLRARQGAGTWVLARPSERLGRFASSGDVPALMRCID